MTSPSAIWPAASLLRTLRAIGCRQKVHGMDKFIRPCLHVLGLWAHGHSIQMMLCPPDIPEDSWTHIEGIALMLDGCLTRSGNLPVHFHLQLDNCPRDNKNQKLFRFCTMLIELQVVRTVCVAFLRKGHTHEDIDAVFGQLAVTISDSEFDDIGDVAELLSRKLRDVGVDKVF